MLSTDLSAISFLRNEMDVLNRFAKRDDLSFEQECSIPHAADDLEMQAVVALEDFAEIPKPWFISAFESGNTEDALRCNGEGRTIKIQDSESTLYVLFPYGEYDRVDITSDESKALIPYAEELSWEALTSYQKIVVLETVSNLMYF